MSEDKQSRPWWSSVGGGEEKESGGGGGGGHAKLTTLKETRNEGRCLLCQYNYANVKKKKSNRFVCEFRMVSGLSVSLCNRNTF